MTLRVRYQTFEFDFIDIHVCSLRNKQEFSDPNGIAHSLGISSSLWPLFGVVWPSSIVLAHYISNYHTDGKTILEIGCGVGLPSLLLNKKNANITATDYHPEVEFFLQRNTELNQDKGITFERVDWADKSDQLSQFDLIIGSDLLYEDQHINLLAQFIENHSKKKCEVIIVDPGRGRKNKLRQKMEMLGFTCSIKKPDTADYLEQGFKGYILEFMRGF